MAQQTQKGFFPFRRTGSSQFFLTTQPRSQSPCPAAAISRGMQLGAPGLFPTQNQPQARVCINLQSPHKSVFFSQLYVCLSRACLGRMLWLQYKTAQNRRVFPHQIAKIKSAAEATPF
eukprot:COSAG06_NODE_4799_length_3945_cov_8.420376_9_plen_118_part_00